MSRMSPPNGKLPKIGTAGIFFSSGTAEKNLFASESERERERMDIDIDIVVVRRKDIALAAVIISDPPPCGFVQGSGDIYTGGYTG